jgi:ABC-type transporter Mla maintaining outer membrane lipid asymmetry ATPase subunit MlaF
MTTLNGTTTEHSHDRPPQVVVELAGVTRAYGRPPVLALNGVSLLIHPGELVAVVGASGSGKSTLLNIIGTLDRASSGTVRIDGIDVADCRDRDLAALRAWRFVFQHFNLVEQASLLDNVADSLLYTGRPRRRRRRAANALTRVGLAHRMRHEATRSPAANGNGPLSPEPSSEILHCCWLTNPPATSTLAPAPALSSSCATCTASAAPS